MSNIHIYERQDEWVLPIFATFFIDAPAYKGHSGWYMYMYVTLISSIISYLTLKYFFSIIKTKSNEYVEANKQTILHS